jgi:hypothetical protein
MPKGHLIIDEITPHSPNNIDASYLKNIQVMKNYDLGFLKDKLIIKEHIFNDAKTNIEEELLNEMKQISNIGLELEENEQGSMIPHEIISDFDSFFESYYIKYWRIYVTIGVTIVYIVIIRSLIYVLSPMFSLKLKKENKFRLNPINREAICSEGIINEKIELKPIKEKRKVNLVDFPSITSLDQE